MGLVLIPFVYQPAIACCFSARCEYRAEAGVTRVISDKVPVHKLSHLKHGDNLLAIEYRQQLFVCADVALILGILELVFLRIYSQSFLVSSVRGSGSFPTTAVSAASGCTGLLRAFLGAASFLGVGIGQLERAGLGCQAKNQLCF